MPVQHLVVGGRVGLPAVGGRVGLPASSILSSALTNDTCTPPPLSQVPHSEAPPGTVRGRDGISAVTLGAMEVP